MREDDTPQIRRGASHREINFVSFTRRGALAAMVTRRIDVPEANIIAAHMEVIGSDGAHVGTVDALENGQIKLTKDGATDGQHHYIDAGLVQDIKGNTVTLTKPAALVAQDSLTADEPIR